MHTTFSYLIQNFCLPCIHMSKYTNNRSSQLLCIYIFTVFKSPFLGTTTTKKNTHKIRYFKPSLPFSFKLVCLCKRMPQSAYKLFADLTTCNCILQCELYKLWARRHLFRFQSSTANYGLEWCKIFAQTFWTLLYVVNLMEYNEYFVHTYYIV